MTDHTHSSHPAIVKRLNAEINKVLASPQGKEYIQKMGATPMEMSPDQLRGFVSSEIKRYGQLISAAGIPKK